MPRSGVLGAPEGFRSYRGRRLCLARPAVAEPGKADRSKRHPDEQDDGVHEHAAVSVARHVDEGVRVPVDRGSAHERVDEPGQGEREPDRRDAESQTPRPPFSGSDDEVVGGGNLALPSPVLQLAHDEGQSIEALLRP